MKVLVSGANGHLGRRLIAAIKADHEVVALVRSESAATAVRTAHGEDMAVQVADYTDEAGLKRAMIGCERCVHLVGIIKESKSNPFHLAHEAACDALVKASASAGVAGIVHLSILGSGIGVSNTCLASRGRAEAILAAGAVPSRVIRVPMVLGEDDYASRALLRQASGRFAVMFRASSLEQPIYAGDVVSVLASSLQDQFGHEVIDLAGPESLSRRALVQRASRVLGMPGPVILSLPLALGLGLAAALELTAHPPVTRAMLGVLDHDDRVDVSAACIRLGLTLTPLDRMLERVLGNAE